MAHGAERSAGLARAITAAGGVRSLAKKLKVSHAAIVKWRVVPEDRLRAVVDATGIAAEILRPDLAVKLRALRQEERMAAARARHALSGVGTAIVLPPLGGKAVDLFDFGLVMAAVAWVAERRGLKTGDILRNNNRPAQSARAYASALAFVAGRVSSTTVGTVLGTSRQNVENCGERYLRARDGDEGDDWDDPDFDPAQAGYVIERGRRRRQKAPGEDWWAAEAEFLAWLEGRE